MILMPPSVIIPEIYPTHMKQSPYELPRNWTKEESSYNSKISDFFFFNLHGIILHALFNHFLTKYGSLYCLMPH